MKTKIGKWKYIRYKCLLCNCQYWFWTLFYKYRGKLATQINRARWINMTTKRKWIGAVINFG